MREPYGEESRLPSGSLVTIRHCSAERDGITHKYPFSTQEELKLIKSNKFLKRKF